MPKKPKGKAVRSNKATKEVSMSDVKNVEVISVRRLEGAGNIKAFVDIRVGGALVITQCSVIDGKRGLFATLPRQVGRDGLWRDVVIAADDDLRSHYQSEILKAYEEDITAVSA